MSGSDNLARMNQLDSAFPRRSKRKRETRERILAAAYRLFSSEGYADAAMADIAVAADVHVATLFTHFKSKKELSAALAEGAIIELEMRVDQARACNVPFFEFIRAVASEWAAAEQSMPARNLAYGYQLRGDPELAFSWLQYQKRELSLYAGYIAAEYGLDPENDPRPHLVAGMISRGNVLALERWLDSKGASNLKHDVLTALDATESILRGSLANPKI
ncbi:MAG TPA: TetR/AcrR family transcriptional regulator [Rhizomicrobium sp.]